MLRNAKTLGLFQLLVMGVLVLALPCACGDSGKATTGGGGNTVGVDGPNRVARLFSEAMAKKDIQTCRKLSTGFMGDLCEAIQKVQVNTEGIVSVVREKFPVEGKKDLGLRTVERTYLRILDRIWINFTLDGLLSEDPKAGVNVYQVKYDGLRGGSFSKEMKVTRQSDGNWRVTEIEHELFSADFLVAVKNQVTKVENIVPTLRARIEKEEPKSVEKALLIASKIQVERTAPPEEK